MLSIFSIFSIESETFLSTLASSIFLLSFNAIAGSSGELVLSENEQPVKPVTYSVIKHGMSGMTKYFASLFAGSDGSAHLHQVGKRGEAPWNRSGDTVVTQVEHLEAFDFGDGFRDLSRQIISG